jgi:hypothetical protein
MSMGDIRVFFDKLVDAAGVVAKIEGLRSRARDRAEAGKKCCGNCHNWMKSRECPRERNVNGYTRGPSMNGSPCKEYYEEDRAKANRAEAARLNAEADALAG